MKGIAAGIGHGPVEFTMGLALPMTQVASAPACGQSQHHFCRLGKTDPLWHQDALQPQ